MNVSVKTLLDENYGARETSYGLSGKNGMVSLETYWMRRNYGASESLLGLLFYTTSYAGLEEDNNDSGSAVAQQLLGLRIAVPRAKKRLKLGTST